MRTMKMLVMLFMLSAAVSAVGQQSLPPAPNQSAHPVTPDWFIYRAIFHDVVAFKKRADAAEKKGIDRSHLRQLVAEKGGLDEDDGKVLEAIADQCESAVAAQDAKAKPLIDAYHAKYPYGIINSTLPVQPPPPQLDEMWQERINLILAARNQLRNSLGDEKFSKFDQAFKKPGSSSPLIPPIYNPSSKKPAPPQGQ